MSSQEIKFAVISLLIAWPVTSRPVFMRASAAHKIFAVIFADSFAVIAGISVLTANLWKPRALVWKRKN